MKLLTIKMAAVAAVLFMGTSLLAKAQGPYARLGLGYQFAMGAGTEEQRTASQRDRVKLGFGKGVIGTAAFGYMFNPNVGAELGFGYLAGARTDLKSVYSNRVENDSYYARMLLLQPAIVISAGKEGLNPYAKFGLVAAKGKLVQEFEYNQNGTLEGERHWTGGWGLGLHAALGVEFGLSDQLAFFSEISMNNLSYAPERDELVLYRYNGNDVLHQVRIRDRETVYVDSYTEGGRPDSLPREELKQNLPLSSVGVNIGVKFNF